MPMDEPILKEIEAEQSDSSDIALDFESRPRLRRIPNIAHAVLFVAITGFLLAVLQIILAAIGKSPASVKGGVITLVHPILQLGVMGVAYALTLLISALVFPLLWRRPFLAGLQWNFSAARSRASFLVALGLFLGFTVALVTRFYTPPKSLPVDQFLTTATSAWIITAFGTILAPLFEEICFRGFLVPAFAIAYDWITKPRTEEGRLEWQTTTTLTSTSYIFAAILSSVCFALIHADQVAHQLPPLLALFSISLVLTYVRINTRSVACSTLVHSAYNGFVFLTAIFATGGYRHLDRLTH
jgi:membrane protease YdiL (CAAX protease family)